jgi:dTDP-4-dehydrorhamnose 3,5-epimerase
MIFRKLALAGAYLLEPERVEDERGFFARTWCERECAEHGIEPPRWVQCSVSFNARKGTLRGMHYQAAPHEETKLVRCTRGAIQDVLVDLREGSPTCRRWVAGTLSAENRHQFLIPPGVAHGFQTLEDGSEVFYQIAGWYHPASSRGVRWDDPALGIAWPLPVSVVSDKDRSYNYLPFPEPPRTA